MISLGIGLALVLGFFAGSWTRQCPSAIPNLALSEVELDFQPIPDNELLYPPTLERHRAIAAWSAQGGPWGEA
jgi:hypothetical protein